MTTATLFYRRLASPLHATRATVGGAWASALIAVALLNDHPLVLGALTFSIVLAGMCTGVRAALVRSLRTALIVALPIVTVNVLVSREGLTVFLRLGDLGPFGQGNLTVEALAYGGIIALKVAIVMLATTLASLAVDPDELLRVLRRLSFRSALTASLAVRMVPVLASDARRLAEAQRTRPTQRTGGEGVDGAGGAGQHTFSGASHARPRAGVRTRAKLRLLSAIVGSSLDRAMDVAATLELRGFAVARRAPRARRPWSRHDLAFAASGASLAALALAARLTGIASFETYPQLRGGGILQALGFAALLTLLALFPFADRRGIEP